MEIYFLNSFVVTTQTIYIEFSIFTLFEEVKFHIIQVKFEGKVIIFNVPNIKRFIDINEKIGNT